MFKYISNLKSKIVFTKNAYTVVTRVYSYGDSLIRAWIIT